MNIKHKELIASEIYLLFKKILIPLNFKINLLVNIQSINVLPLFIIIILCLSYLILFSFMIINNSIYYYKFR